MRVARYLDSRADFLAITHENFEQLALLLPSISDFGLCIVQLRHDQPQERARQFRKTGMVLFDRRDQLLDMAEDLWRDDAKFCQMGT